MSSDATVTCFVSEECALPCSFPPGSQETVEWFRQDVAVYKFEREGDDDGDSKNSSEEHSDYKQLSGRASVFPHLISRGNATLLLRSGDLKDRGTYRCHVRTSNGEHDAKVILKVEGEFKKRKLRCPVQNKWDDYLLEFPNFSCMWIL